MCVCIYLYICISNSCFFGFGCLPSFPPCGCLVALALVTAHVATGRDMIHAMQSLWWNENAGKKVLASLRFLSCTTPSLSVALIQPYWLTGRKTPTYLLTRSGFACSSWVVGTSLQQGDTKRGNFRETGWSVYGLSHAHKYCLEVNWPWWQCHVAHVADSDAFFLLLSWPCELLWSMDCGPSWVCCHDND